MTIEMQIPADITEALRTHLGRTCQGSRYELSTPSAGDQSCLLVACSNVIDEAKSWIASTKRASAPDLMI